jgi:hypothetical protein
MTTYGVFVSSIFPLTVPMLRFPISPRHLRASVSTAPQDLHELEFLAPGSLIAYPRQPPLLKMASDKTCLPAYLEI